MSTRLHPILYAIVALVAVSAAIAHVAVAFPAAPAAEAVFVAPPSEAADAPKEAESGTPQEPDVAAAWRAIEIPSAETLFPPISHAASRVTKKPFGIEIHPHTSPVPNDRFDGFHVGVDFEIFEGEEDIDVPIFVACEGPLLLKTWARGYGGVAVQRCKLDGKGVVVIYGHMRVESVAARVGEVLKPGRKLGVLGTGYGPETDGTRKHLHFGIHESATTTDIRGYVKTEAEVAEWLDALEYMTP